VRVERQLLSIRGKLVNLSDARARSTNKSINSRSMLTSVGGIRRNSK
jgi:hypothetical protein